jgi:hypothetical protein
MLKTDIEEIGLGDMDYIDLVRDTDQWWPLMNTAITFWVP